MNRKNWKYWAPFQTKRQKEIIQHLTEKEKEEVYNLSKECGKKGGISFIPLIIILFILFEKTNFNFSVKIGIGIIVFIINLLLTIKFVSLPYRNKQLSVLNNSKYAQEKGVNV